MGRAARVCVSHYSAAHVLALVPCFYCMTGRRVAGKCSGSMSTSSWAPTKTCRVAGSPSSPQFSHSALLKWILLTKATKNMHCLTANSAKSFQSVQSGRRACWSMSASSWAPTKTCTTAGSRPLPRGLSMFTHFTTESNASQSLGTCTTLHTNVYCTTGCRVAGKRASQCAFSCGRE